MRDDALSFISNLDARLREPMKPMVHPEVLGKLLPNEVMLALERAVSLPPLTPEELDASIQRTADAVSKLAD